MTWAVAAAAMLFAVGAQIVLHRYTWLGLTLYGVALGLWLWAMRRDGRLLGEPRPLPEPCTPSQPWYRQPRRLILLGVCAVATAVNVVYSWDDTFETVGVVAWVISVGTFVAAFWERRHDEDDAADTPLLARLGIATDGWRLSWPIVAFLLVLAVGAGFRFYHLRQVPPEINWDHIEKLMDIRDVVERGLRPSFFYRNTGREPWQFYWTAALIWLTGLPVGFYALKLGTAIAGLLTLPGVYLMAREVYGRWVGLWATFFVAVASWPVLLSRVGLRYPFAPLASAWAFYFMLRGLRTGQRNDFILLGLTLGVGLNGYTAFRAVPLAVALCWTIVWLAARRSDLGRRLRLGNLALAVSAALLVFVPLGTFMLWKPRAFWGRSLWYLADNEIPGSPLLVFLNNLKNLALMFHWRGDMVPMSTIRYEPVLDPILGGLMVLGLAVALARIVSRRYRDHLTLGLLVAGAVALLPSALALPFPKENPSVVRTGSGMPVVLTVVALPVGVWTAGVARAWGRRWQRALAAVGVIALAVALMWVNERRVFVRYVEGYRRAVVNTSEIADAIRGFDATLGSMDDVYVIAWPWWMDIRSLALELGRPDWANLLESADLAAEHAGDGRARMYILHPSDKANLERLQQLFPTGITRVRHSQWGWDFVLYIVPGDVRTNAQPSTTEEVP